jgi:hypothetical protein
MAPKYYFPCFKCKSEREVNRKTLHKHFRLNQDHLAHLRASGANQDTVNSVQGCHYLMMEMVNELGGPSRGPYSSRQSGPTDSVGEHLISYDFNHLLICLDLADASIAPPPFSEGELAVNDAMMVDDDCE